MSNGQAAGEAAASHGTAPAVTPAPAQARAPGVAAPMARMMALTRGNVAAAMQSGQIWTAGCLDISREAAAIAQTRFDRAAATWKAMAGVTSIKAAVALQAEHAQAALGGLAGDSARMAHASIQLAERTLAPISAHVTRAVAKVADTAG
jgi:hypothetical protein